MTFGIIFLYLVVGASLSVLAMRHGQMKSDSIPLVLFLWPMVLIVGVIITLGEKRK